VFSQGDQTLLTPAQQAGQRNQLAGAIAGNERLSLANASGAFTKGQWHDVRSETGLSACGNRRAAATPSGNQDVSREPGIPEQQ